MAECWKAQRKKPGEQQASKSNNRGEHTEVNSLCVYLHARPQSRMLCLIFAMFQIKLIVLAGIKMILWRKPASQTLFCPKLSEQCQQEEGIRGTSLIKANLKGCTGWGRAYETASWEETPKSPSKSENCSFRAPTYNWNTEAADIFTLNLPDLSYKKIKSSVSNKEFV